MAASMQAHYAGSREAFGNDARRRKLFVSTQAPALARQRASSPMAPKNHGVPCISVITITAIAFISVDSRRDQSTATSDQSSATGTHISSCCIKPLPTGARAPRTCRPRSWHLGKLVMVGVNKKRFYRGGTSEE